MAVMTAPCFTHSPPMFCRGCGYSLIALPGCRCPECGREFDPADRRTFRSRPRRPLLRLLIRAVIVLLCVTLPPATYFGYLAWRVHDEAAAVQVLKQGPLGITFYDTRPTWARAALPDSAAWLWRRAEKVEVQFNRSRGSWDAAPELPALARLHSLRVLRLEMLDVTDADISCIGGLTDLQHIELWETGVTDVGLSQLNHLSALQTLDVSRNPKITDKGLEHFAHLTALQELGLEDTAVGDEGLARIEDLMALRKLDLRGTAVTDAGLVHLHKLRNLTNLNLYGTRVTGSGFTSLTGLVGLRTLDLGHSQLTDAGLAQVTVFPALSDLGLEDFDESVSMDWGVRGASALRSLKSLRHIHAFRSVPAAMIFHFAGLPSSVRIDAERNEAGR